MKLKLILCALCSLLFNVQKAKSQHNQPNNISLAGSWYYAIDIADEGIQKKWFLGNLEDTYLGNINFIKKPLIKYNFIPSFRDTATLPNTSDLMGIGNPDQSPWINYLQRKHKYIGALWFQKTITIPENFNGYETVLYLERVKWQSRVWLDGTELSSSPQDGLVTAHQHQLGKLKPGKYLLSIRIDNRMIHPIGDKGHNYTEQTESIWNGIIGEIKLVRKPIVHFDNLQIYSNLNNKTISVKINTKNSKDTSLQANINLKIWNENGKLINNFSLLKTTGKQNDSLIFTVKPAEFKLWSAENPHLYQAELTLLVNGQTQGSGKISFGNRLISTSKYKILVNNNPEFIRGNQEALGYPPTGHPPMDVATWRNIFKKYKEYGLNQVRFHSSTPPEAAFQAADEIGIYIMTELIWMTSINAKKDLRPISATTGIPQGLGNNDRTLDDFIYRESKKLINQFGNHPSFVFFSFGNEMDNLNKEKVNEWIKEFKSMDNRHLYAATTARAVLNADDFQDSHIVAGHGQVVNADNFSLKNNYDSAYYYTKVPVIAHELGQYPAHPLWSDIDKYKNTPFNFINLEKAKQQAVLNGTAKQDSIFQYVSGKTQLMLYKSEIERQYRSQYSAGFNLLQMNDYTGQGEALVGWLDAFYNEKNYVQSSPIKHFINKLVILATFDKRIYQGNENFKFNLKINNSSTSLKKEGIAWKIIDKNGFTKANGLFKSINLKLAEPTDIGSDEIRLSSDWEMGKYTLAAQTLDGKFQNEWEFWIYPNQTSSFDETFITNDVQKAIKELNQGRKVLLVLNKNVKNGSEDFATFKPVFWSTLFFPGKGNKTLGAVINNEHPIFKNFPTDNFLNWNWRDICEKGQAFVLQNEMLQLKPIVQPVNDFHTGLKLASLLEAKVGKGKLIISGYNLLTDLDKRPATKQLKYSILNYMNSDNFNPEQAINEQYLISNFTSSASNNPTALIYTVNNKQVKIPSYFKFNEVSASKFVFTSEKVVIGKLRIKIKNMSNQELNIPMQIEDRKQNFVLPPSIEKWIELQFFREDFDDQKFIVEISNKGNIKIIEFEIVE